MSSSRGCFEEDQKQQNFFHPPNWKMKKMMKNSKRYSQTRRASQPSLGTIYKDPAQQQQERISVILGQLLDGRVIWGQIMKGSPVNRDNANRTFLYPKENLRFHKKHFIYNDYSPAHSTEDKTGTTTKLITHRNAQAPYYTLL